MQVQFVTRENGPERLVTEAEVHFDGGPHPRGGGAPDHVLFLGVKSNRNGPFLEGSAAVDHMRPLAVGGPRELRQEQSPQTR